MRSPLLLLFMFFILVPVHAFGQGVPDAAPWQDHAAVGKLFAESGTTGTFVLYDPATGVFSGHNRERAATRFIPASTFKIPNTLIGLSIGAVSSVDDILPYGGKPQPYPAWEKDMGLREAIKISNVPVYQELARRIGLERMREGVAALHYGNMEIGTVVDRFWLDGPLQISAVEQTRFLAALAMERLPVSSGIQKAVRAILLVEEGDGWKLFAKTGTAARTSPQTGWWVGWVENNGAIFSFALNVDSNPAMGAGERIAFGKQCLAAMGLCRR
ncbi:Beta-lactamase [uncultured delta proteobacterium]|uniref:Beta-lactamase n=1 Tax=uncultured delta proteobacterium TaxID=34034 RepID=A0A212K2W3_9DELT|nr:Beta-lactamase [uncultured delta proteobacterium]